jgi:hypothetical protein
MTLHDRIMRARQAQVEHEQKHDVQLAVIPFDSACDDEIKDWADPDLGRPFPNDPFSDERFAPENTWATENEYRDEWHRKFDDEWREWIHAHYDREG